MKKRKPAAQPKSPAPRSESYLDEAREKGEGYVDTARKVVGRMTGYSTARQIGRMLRSRSR